MSLLSASLLSGSVLSIILLFWPVYVAKTRKHNNTIPIILLNTFTFWTYFGWIGALVWSFTDNVRDKTIIEYEEERRGKDRKLFIATTSLVSILTIITFISIFSFYKSLSQNYVLKLMLNSLTSQILASSSSGNIASSQKILEEEMMKKFKETIKTESQNVAQIQNPSTQEEKFASPTTEIGRQNEGQASPPPPADIAEIKIKERKR